jgi:hypothetical protein
MTSLQELKDELEMRKTDFGFLQHSPARTAGRKDERNRLLDATRVRIENLESEIKERESELNPDPDE